MIIPYRLGIEYISFGLQKNSPYLPLFNYHIKSMNENGILDQILSYYELQEQECSKPSLSLGFESCIIAFFPIIGGMTFSLFLLAVEYHPESWTRLSMLLNYYDRKY